MKLIFRQGMLMELWMWHNVSVRHVTEPAIFYNIIKRYCKENGFGTNSKGKIIPYDPENLFNLMSANRKKL